MEPESKSAPLDFGICVCCKPTVIAPAVARHLLPVQAPCAANGATEWDTCSVRPLHLSFHGRRGVGPARTALSNRRRRGAQCPESGADRAAPTARRPP